MKAIHKRHHEWRAAAFATLGEAAEFIAALEGLLVEAGTASEPTISVSTDDRDYPDLTVEELEELSLALSLESVGTLFINSGHGNDQPVNVELLIRTLDPEVVAIDFKASGSNQIAVDGINVWAIKEIDERIERIKDARELAEAKSEPPADDDLKAGPRSGWWLFLSHPLSVQILGGTIAALIAGVILYLLLS